MSSFCAKHIRSWRTCWSSSSRRMCQARTEPLCGIVTRRRRVVPVVLANQAAFAGLRSPSLPSAPLLLQSSSLRLPVVEILV
jgi:hypothetical protein